MKQKESIHQIFFCEMCRMIFCIGASHSYRSSAAAATLALTTTSASERTFPPQTGLTYSSWVFLEVLPAVPSYMSAVGLLTVEKHWEDMSTKRLVNSSILQIYLDLQSKSLVVCETHFDFIKLDIVNFEVTNIGRSGLKILLFNPRITFGRRV